MQDYNVYGDGVNIAARLQSVAEPGTICVSEAVYQQVYTKLDVAFADLGIKELKKRAIPILRGESAWWWLFLAGVIVFTVGLTRLRGISVAKQAGH